MAPALALEIVAAGSAICFTRPSLNRSSKAEAASARITSPATSSNGRSGSVVSCTDTPAPCSVLTAWVKAATTSGSAFWAGPGRTQPTFIPRACAAGRARGGGSSADHSSRGSGPAMADSTISQSSAERAMGPSLSIVHERAIAPWRETRPKVGRTPAMPQKLDGQMIEPHVSEPRAKPVSAAATAAPEPDDEPQLHLPVSQGLRAAPVAEAHGTL